MHHSLAPLILVVFAMRPCGLLQRYAYVPPQEQTAVCHTALAAAAASMPLLYCPFLLACMAGWRGRRDESETGRDEPNSIDSTHAKRANEGGL